MRHLQKIIICLLIVCSVIDTKVVYAYDLTASHIVNQTIDFEATRKKVWDVVKSQGFSDEATAGIVGNIGLESGGFNYTVTQGHVDWSKFVLGKVGIGLAQWTSQGRQMTLFSLADDRGKQWTELDVQLECLLLEMDSSNWWSFNNAYTSLDDFKSRCKDIDEACIIFMKGFERPNELYAHLDIRKTYAYDSFNALSGSETTYVLSGGSSRVDIDAKVSSIISEWDLVGMPKKSTLSSSSGKVFMLSNDSLSVGEMYSVEKVKERALDDSKYTLLGYSRVALVFIGLVLMVYAMFLLVGFFFDKTNTLIGIYLLQVVSFGKLKYCEDRESLKDRSFVDGKRITIIYCIVNVIGFALVTGSLFKWVAELLSLIRSIF